MYILQWNKPVLTSQKVSTLHETYMYRHTTGVICLGLYMTFRMYNNMLFL